MKMRFPVYFLFFVVYLLRFCSCKGEELMRNPHRGRKERTGLFSTIKGYTISLVFKTLQVADALGCAYACLKESNCQSINFDTSGYPEHLCELSQVTLDSRPYCKIPRPGFIHLFPVQKTNPARSDTPCINITCKNGATCEPACNEQGYHCRCGAFNEGQLCQLWTVNVLSCKDIFDKTSYRKDMAYTYMIDSKQTDIYCHMSSDLCGSRGWTLVMKTNGSKQTFRYGAAFWSNKNAYELSAGKTGFDGHETKMPSYWAMPFQNLCVGMQVGNNLNWINIPYTASSLYDVIADGGRRSLSLGRSKWMSLIGGSSLQRNCNSEGFNSLSSTRIGIRANQENDCNSPDSAIGFGLSLSVVTCGNFCRLTCSNGDKRTVALGYILIK